MPKESLGVPLLLRRQHRLTPSVVQLIFAAPQAFRYRAGQYLLLRPEGAPEAARLPFSLAAASVPGRLELCIGLARGPAGEPAEELARALQAQPAGQRFLADGPYGEFAAQGADEPALFVAAGTGIGPIRAVLQELRGQSAVTRRVLLLGARTEPELLFHQEWLQRVQDWPGFEYWPTLSQAHQRWTGRRGYVQHHLREWAHPGPLRVYLCGMPGMVTAVKNELLAAGLQPERLITERY